MRGNIINNFINTGIKIYEDGHFVGRKTWIAKLIGPHPEFVFNRKFLPSKYINEHKHIHIHNIKPNDILEFGNKETNLKSYFFVESISNDKVVLKPIDRQTAIKFINNALH